MCFTTHKLQVAVSTRSLLYVFNVFYGSNIPSTKEATNPNLTGDQLAKLVK